MSGRQICPEGHLSSFNKSKLSNECHWTLWDDESNQATFVQVMAWCRQATTSHYMNQCWPSSLSSGSNQGLRMACHLLLLNLSYDFEENLPKSTFPNSNFYPRPVLAFGYCRCLRVCVCLSVCPSVCQSLTCPGDNSGPVQARIAKFGPKMQKTLVKVPIVLGGNWPWLSRSNLT